MTLMQILNTANDAPHAIKMMREEFEDDIDPDYNPTALITDERRAGGWVDLDGEYHVQEIVANVHVRVVSCDHLRVWDDSLYYNNRVAHA